MGRENWRARLALKAAHGRDLLTKLSLPSALVLHVCCGAVHVQSGKCLKVCLLDGDYVVMATNLDVYGKEL